MEYGIDEILKALSLEGKERREALAEIPLDVLLEEWDRLDPEETRTLFLALDLESKTLLISSLLDADQEEIVRYLSGRAAERLFAEMEPDDLADLFRTISPEVRKSAWESLDDESKKETLFLLRFEEDDAAGIMTPRYLAVSGSNSVGQALSFIRRSAGDVEAIYNVYVVDAVSRLIGMVTLRELLSAADQTPIRDVMDDKPVYVVVDTDQEETARILETYDLAAVPVIDGDRKLLGVVTFDDVIDVIREEQTEDVYKMGAMDGRVDPYMDESIFALVRKRIPWLIILLLVGTITTNVLDRYEPIVISAAFLFIFMPVITQTGGNSGSQSSTLMIRGLATGEIKFRDFWWVVLKEILVGLIMGIGTGVVIFLRSYFLPPGVEVIQAVVIGIALSFVVMFSTLIGAIAPLLINKMGFDPTVMSAPLMATVIDVAGLTIYFETARWLLKL